MLVYVLNEQRAEKFKKKKEEIRSNTKTETNPHRKLRFHLTFSYITKKVKLILQLFIYLNESNVI